MYKYFNSYEIKEIKIYCQNKCKYIVINNSSDIKNLEYYRGMYLGYLYGIKVSNKILNTNISIKRYELYNQFKSQKSLVLFDDKYRGLKAAGMKDSLLDILNLISCYQYPMDVSI